MPRSPAARKLTAEEILEIPEDGKRHELIDGVHYVMATPVVRHQRVVMRLGVSIAIFLDATGLGEVFAVPLDTVLSPHDVVEPDLIYVSAERSHLLDRYLTGAPDLVVEVLSPSTSHLDRNLKRRLYERAGVPEYWMMNSNKNTVRVYRLGPTGATDPAEYGTGVELSAAAGDVLTSPLLPGWELPLSKLFA